MIFEEKGLFLEIVDIIRSLGLTILKGIMEVHGDKVWAKFVVQVSAFVSIASFYPMGTNVHIMLQNRDLERLLHFLCFPRINFKGYIHDSHLTSDEVFFLFSKFYVSCTRTKSWTRNVSSDVVYCFLTQASKDVQRVDVLMQLVQQLPLSKKSNTVPMPKASQAVPKWPSVRFSRKYMKPYPINWSIPSSNLGTAMHLNIWYAWSRMWKKKRGLDRGYVVWNKLGMKGNGFP